MQYIEKNFMEIDYNMLIQNHVYYNTLSKKNHLMEGIVDDPHPRDNVTTHITPKNDLTRDLMHVEKFIRENFTLEVSNGHHVMCEKKSNIVDGIEEKTNENEVDWLHTDHVC
jgi:hypothetical protein